MGVNSTGLNQTPRQISQVSKAQAASTKENTQNQSTARTQALANANAPVNTTSAPVTTAAAVVSGTPAASAPIGGTTIPSSGLARIATQAQAMPSQAAQAVANAFSPAFMAATGAVAAVTNRRRGIDGVGDAKEGAGDVGLETKAEAEGHLATKDTNSETGKEATDISGANSTSGPST